MIDRNILNDPSYTAEQKVQLMQLMVEFAELHRQLEQKKEKAGLADIKATYTRALELIAKMEEVTGEVIS